MKKSILDHIILDAEYTNILTNTLITGTVALGKCEYLVLE